MALASVIRRWHLRDGMPILEIARRTGLSRNTVRKYLASQDSNLTYPPRKSPSKLNDYEETLTSWLFRHAGFFLREGTQLILARISPLEKRQSPTVV